MNNINAEKFFTEIDSILKDIGLRYFLLGGTHLGAIRDHSFIKIDWDIDLGCFDEEFILKRNILLKKFRIENFNNVQWKRGFGGEIRGMNVNKIFGNNNLHCCIMSFKKINNWRYYHYNKIGDAKVLPADKLEDLKQIKFCSCNVNVPSDSEFILEYIYGKDWMIPHSKQQQAAWLKTSRYCNFNKPVKNGNRFWWAEG
jgi:phosphorylcholine metabolism protein LicD